jgi:hypothetical protein
VNAKLKSAGTLKRGGVGVLKVRVVLHVCQAGCVGKPVSDD